MLAYRQPGAAYAGTDKDPDPMPACDQARHDGEELRYIAPALEHRHQEIPPIGHRAVLLPLTEDDAQCAAWLFHPVCGSRGGPMTFCAQVAKLPRTLKDRHDLYQTTLGIIPAHV